MEATTETPPSRSMMVLAGSMATHSSDIRYFCKPPVANWETDAVAASRYRLPMSDLMAQWVREALASADMTQVRMAEHLTKRLKRTYDKAAVNKMARNKRQVQADEMYAISEIAGFPTTDEGTPLTRVPKLSWVSASQLADVGDVPALADAATIPVAGLPAGDWLALEVDGDSMDRVAPSGSVILVNRAERRLLHHRFFVFSERGEATFKRYVEKPVKRLEPYSSNPHHEPIYPRQRGLVVVGRVRRVLLDL